MVKRATALAAALAAAIGVAPATSTAITAIQIDFDGIPGGATANVSRWTLDPGDIVFENLIDGVGDPANANANEGTTFTGDPATGFLEGDVRIFAQGTANGLDVNNNQVDGQFTYQFIFDSSAYVAGGDADDDLSNDAIVTVDGVDIGAVTGTPEKRITVGATGGIIRFFWNPNRTDDGLGGGGVTLSGDNDKNGLCFGNLGDSVAGLTDPTLDPLCSGPDGDQVWLGDGTIEFTQDMVITETEPDVIQWLDSGQGGGLPPSDLDVFGNTGTTSVAADMRLEIDILTQNRDHVINEFVDSTLEVDVEMTSGGAGAPYLEDESSAPTIKVAGFNGQAETAGDPTQTFLGDDESIEGPYVGPINDFGCFNSDPADFDGVYDDCALQMEIGGTLAFKQPVVSEPAPLLLVGAGFGLAGLLAHRRRRQKRA